MKFFITSLCIMLASNLLLAQGSTWNSSVGGPDRIGYVINDLLLRKQSETLSTNEDPQPIQSMYKQYGGSPFLNSGPMLGSILTKNGDVINDLTIMYDLYSNELFILEDGREQVLKKHLIKEMKLNVDGEMRLFKRCNPNLPDRFFEVLFDDDELALYKVLKITKSDGRNNGMVSTDSKLLQSTVYFMTNKKKRKSAHSLNLRKKNIFKYLGNKRTKACQKFISDQKKFKLKSEESYINMLEATKIKVARS